MHHDNAPAYTSMHQSCRNHVSTTVFTGLFALPKTEDIDERNAFCYDWGDKRKIKAGAKGDTKSASQKCFENWKVHKCIISYIYPDLFKKVITSDESWVYLYGYDIETIVQSSKWLESKALQVRSYVRVLLTVFFDCNGVVHHAFLPQALTIWSYAPITRNKSSKTHRTVKKPIIDFAPW